MGVAFIKWDKNEENDKRCIKLSPKIVKSENVKTMYIWSTFYCMHNLKMQLLGTPRKNWSVKRNVCFPRVVFQNRRKIDLLLLFFNLSFCLDFNLWETIDFRRTMITILLVRQIRQIGMLLVGQNHRIWILECITCLV